MPVQSERLADRGEGRFPDWAHKFRPQSRRLASTRAPTSCTARRGSPQTTFLWRDGGLRDGLAEAPRPCKVRRHENTRFLSHAIPPCYWAWDWVATRHARRRPSCSRLGGFGDGWKALIKILRRLPDMLGYEAAGLDLAPGSHQRNIAPEH